LRHFLPFIVLPLLGLTFVVLPRIFPDHGVVYDAILAGDVDGVRSLLDRGADPNSRRATLSEVCWFLYRPIYSQTGHAPDLSVREPLLVEALHHNQNEIAKLLLESGADANAADELGYTALWKAVSLDDSDLVRLLLEKGANPLTKMPGDGSTALRAGGERRNAFRTQNREIIRLITAAESSN
jgi:hypothetical protein